MQDVLLDSTTDLDARSWVGWVRVAGEAGVIDALAPWQNDRKLASDQAGTVKSDPVSAGSLRFPGPHASRVIASEPARRVGTRRVGTRRVSLRWMSVRWKSVRHPPTDHSCGPAVCLPVTYPRAYQSHNGQILACQRPGMHGRHETVQRRSRCAWQDHECAPGRRIGPICASQANAGRNGRPRALGLGARTATPGVRSDQRSGQTMCSGRTSSSNSFSLT